MRQAIRLGHPIMSQTIQPTFFPLVAPHRQRRHRQGSRAWTALRIFHVKTFPAPLRRRSHHARAPRRHSRPQMPSPVNRVAALLARRRRAIRARPSASDRVRVPTPSRSDRQASPRYRHCAPVEAMAPSLPQRPNAAAPPITATRPCAVAASSKTGYEGSYFSRLSGRAQEKNKAGKLAPKPADKYGRLQRTPRIDVIHYIRTHRPGSAITISGIPALIYPAWSHHGLLHIHPVARC